MAKSRGRPPKNFTIEETTTILDKINSQNDGKGLTPEEIGMSDYLLKRPGGPIALAYVARDTRGTKGRPAKVYILSETGAQFLFENRHLVKEATPPAPVAVVVASPAVTAEQKQAA